MVTSERDVTRVSFQSRNQGLCRIIPDLNRLVVGGGEEVRFIGLRIVVDVIYALRFVSFQREVGMRGAKAPDFDCPVQTCGCKRVGILRIDGQPHHIVAMTLIDLNALPTLLPVPEFDCHVIGGGENERLGRMDHDRTDIIWVSFEGRDLLGGVVVVDTELEVVRTANNPVLAGDETAGSYGDIGKLKSFDN